MYDDEKLIEEKFNNEYKRFKNIWEKLKDKFNATIIQNNFEYPYYRLLGNKDASDIHGKINFIIFCNKIALDRTKSYCLFL